MWLFCKGNRHRLWLSANLCVKGCEASGINIDQYFILNHEEIYMSIGIRHSITAGQCRAARALLDITQPELAEAAGLGLSTIVDFEKSRRDVSRTAVHAMREALEKAGIQFIAKNGGGPGVRLRQ
jgi:DNA-binding XRE family transcriptional regulator